MAWGALAGFGIWALIVLFAIACGKASKRRPRPRPTLTQLIDTVWYDPERHEWHRKDSK